jgi:hypothetical protein
MHLLVNCDLRNMMILLIAFVPALAVLLIAIWSKRKSVTALAALLAGALGQSTGNPAYAPLDIAAVVGATWLAWRTVNFSQKPPPAAELLHSEVNSVKVKSSTDGVNSTAVIWFFIVISVGAYLWNKTEGQAERRTPVKLPVQTTVTPPTQYVKTKPPVAPVSAETARTEPQRVKRPAIQELGGASPGGRTLKITANCEYKGVMADQDYRNCGIEPPRP